MICPGEGCSGGEYQQQDTTNQVERNLERVFFLTFEMKEWCPVEKCGTNIEIQKKTGCGLNIEFSDIFWSRELEDKE